MPTMKKCKAFSSLSSWTNNDDERPSLSHNRSLSSQSIDSSCSSSSSSFSISSSTYSSDSDDYDYDYFSVTSDESIRHVGSCSEDDTFNLYTDDNKKKKRKFHLSNFSNSVRPEENSCELLQIGSNSKSSSASNFHSFLLMESNLIIQHELRMKKQLELQFVSKTIRLSPCRLEFPSVAAIPATSLIPEILTNTTCVDTQ